MLTALLGIFDPSGAVAQDFPPPTLEISADRPLYLFRMEPAAAWTEEAGSLIADRFATIPEGLRPFAAAIVNPRGALSDDFENAVEILGANAVPIFVQVADRDQAQRIAQADIARLLEKQPGVAGVVVSGLRFDYYDRLPDVTPYSAPPEVRWAMDVINTAAQFGRRIVLEFNDVNAARLMANRECAPLLAQIRSLRQHVTTVARLADAHAISGIMTTMGLWLEESVESWGVTATDEWYADAPYMEPGMFGVNQGGAEMPAAFYRAMLLNGIMTGATVFIVEPERALWFADDPAPWREGVRPVLQEALGSGLIPRREFVQRKAQAGLQLVEADTPQQFHLNLRDLSAELDAGFLLYGAYGLEQPGLVHELIPNSGRHYWVPVLSPSAPEEVLKRFARVVPAATMMMAEEWTDLLDRIYQPDGAGTAFISRIGRAVFVMHTRENQYEQQTFRLPRLPAPMYGTVGERVEGGVRLSWPFREDDFAYRIYKRAPDGQSFELVAEVSDERSWLDGEVAPDLAVSYAVTAFTDEGAPHEGTVNYGDYLAFSTVESRIAETIDFAPGAAQGMARRLSNGDDARPVAQTWWPGGEPVPLEYAPDANAIAGRLVDWSRAFQSEDLNGVMALYAADYVDPQGWRNQYVRRAYQWFFERYDWCRLHTQVRTWDFAKAAEGEVSVRVWARGAGVAQTDSAGTRADVQVRFPRTESQETTLVFSNHEGAWRITRTDPALPNMREFLSFSLSPNQGFAPGPDVFPQ